MTSNDIYKEEFLAIVTRSDGRLSPKSINEQFFVKKEKLHLWVHYIESTKSFDQYNTKDRIFFWVNNITNIQYCNCGNPCITINYTAPKTYSKYCSAKCSQTDKGPRKIGASKRNEESSRNARYVTMIEKYGVPYNSQREDIKPVLMRPKVSDEIYQKLIDTEWLNHQYTTLRLSSKEIGESIGCDFSTVLSYLRLSNIDIIYDRCTSKEETQIKEYIESLGFYVKQSSRSLLGGNLEIDIFVPEKNFAIEMNGSYWHSYPSKENNEQRNKHKRKTMLARENNIDLFHITDIEWNTNRVLVEAMISNKLGLSTKLHARKYKVSSISYKDYKDFCKDNHIANVAKANKIYGLVDNCGKIMSLVSFAHSRYDKKVQWEIIRFCSLQNMNIRGGFSKILKHFIETEAPASIGTYSDNRYGAGKVYSTNGFVHTKSTNPGYCWTNTVEMLNRYLCQKKRLPNLLGDLFNPEESESENMFRSKYRRMWDAGHEYFVLTL